MQPIDLNPHDLEIVLAILQKFVPDREVWAFGSRVKWTAKPFSDLDLAIVGEQPLQISIAADLAEAFDESELPIKVDVVDWATTSDAFRKIIEKDKVVVQAQPTGAVVSAPTFSIPAHWESTTLGEICRRGGGGIQTGPFGSQLHASDYVAVGVPSVMPTNIGDNRIIEDGIARITDADANRLGQHKLQVGDIIYSRRGDVEKRALVREREVGWICGTGCLKVRLGKGVIDPLFASLFLGQKEIREWIVRHAVGATMANLNTKIMSAVPVVLPPLNEQLAIAQILGTLHDKIELNRCMNANLEATARAIFRSWFVDFDPVRAKAAGRVPVGMTPEVAALFPDGFEDSELGEIPRGWRLSTLDAVSRLNPEAWSKATRPDEIAYLDLSNTKWGVIEKVTEYSSVDAPSRAQRVLRSGDTIIGTVRPGNGSFAYIDREGLTGSTGFAVLRPLKTEYSEFIYLAATEPENIDRLSLLADGGAYPAVRPEVVLDTAVVFPRKEVLEQFSRQVAPLFALFAENERQSRTLATLRDALLPKLMSGELGIPEALEKTAKAA